MRAHLEITVCKFGHNPTICLREEPIVVPAQKFPYHVTFDLELDLEHILDARPPGDHRVGLCKFGRNRAICFVVELEAICVKVYRRTDGQTDDVYAAPLY